uniref:Secreted protein n=1 Tax=Heterorhabditis bacteriophora TaxID=37862 RepID=A0A1I7XRV7_HETBA
MLTYLSFLMVILLVSSKSVVKRSDNSYGDEMVTPGGGGAQNYGANVAAEQPAPSVAQAPMDNAHVEPSGYRHKRDNSYGDELVTPMGGGAPTFNMAEEQAPEAVNQAPAGKTSVEDSGYRSKRADTFYNKKNAYVN